MTSHKVLTEPRRRPRQARAGATVDAILAAAAEAIARDGFENANVNHIAERAGVSVGSLYQYYPSKEALLVALIERHTSQTLATLEAALAMVSAAPLETAVRQVIAAMIEAHRAPLHQRLARGVDELGHLGEIQRDIDTRAGHAVREFLRARSDVIRVPDADFSAFILVRAIDLLTHAVLADRPAALSTQALENELTALVVGYLQFERLPTTDRAHASP